MKKIFETVLVIVVFAGLVFVVGGSMVKASTQGIIVKCNSLKEQSLNYDLFWISQADKNECDGVNIEIVAPIDHYENNI